MERRVSLSVKVAEEIAARRGVEPTDMEPPLYEMFDPDSLDELFRGSGEAVDSTVSVRFSYDEYTVVVESPGRVTVNGPEAETADRPREHVPTD